MRQNFDDVGKAETELEKFILEGDNKCIGGATSLSGLCHTCLVGST